MIQRLTESVAAMLDGYRSNVAIDLILIAIISLKLDRSALR